MELGKEFFIIGEALVHDRAIPRQKRFTRAPPDAFGQQVESFTPM